MLLHLSTLGMMGWEGVVGRGGSWPRPSQVPPLLDRSLPLASLVHDSAVVCPQMANLVTLVCCVLLAAAVVAYAQRRSQLGE